MEVNKKVKYTNAQKLSKPIIFGIQNYSQKLIISYKFKTIVP